MTPESYITEIDYAFNRSKKQRLSRFSVEWGKWSRDMNIRLRAETEEALREIKDTESRIKYEQLVDCFSYWIAKSKLLGLHHQNKILGSKKKRDLVDEIDMLRKRILSRQYDVNLPLPDMMAMLKKLQ